MSQTKKSPKYRKEKEADDLEKAGKGGTGGNYVPIDLTPKYYPSRLEFFTAAALSGMRVHQSSLNLEYVVKNAINLAKETIKQLEKE